MKRILLFSVIVMLLFFSTISAQKEIPEDPFDVTDEAGKVQELGIPTIASVEALEQKAKSLLSENQWEAAANALEEFAKQANWLSNLIAAGLEPYYSASYDHKKDCPTAIIRNLIRYEKKANELKEKRNWAIVKRASCHQKLGDKKMAVVLLVKALDIIDLKESELWSEAKDNLYYLIGAR